MFILIANSIIVDVITHLSKSLIIVCDNIPVVVEKNINKPLSDKLFL